MADNIPAKLKPAQIGPFVKRANQLEKFKPIITYWLRFYVVQKIISANLHSADNDCSAFTTDLMEKLEHTKAQNPTEEAYVDEEVAAAYCEQFALQTFAKGDKDMTANSVTKNTADTLLAASTFLEMLAIWKGDTDPEIKSKQTFAKYHALRILKAFHAGEDPNLTNPVHDPPPQAASPSALDPNDPEVQNINQSAAGNPPTQNPYQPYVETVPNTSAQPSPTFSAPKLSPPPTHFTSSSDAYRDVSPISQPSTSRRGSTTSAGGGYFPRVDVPTFTADATAPSLPTASTMPDQPMASPLGSSSLPTGSQVPQAPQAPTPQNFYQNTVSSPPAPQFPQQQPPPPQNVFQTPSQQAPFATPHLQQPQQQAPFQHSPQQNFSAPPQQYIQQPSVPPQSLHQGPFRTDEDSQAEAIRHAKFAQSALNFEDVPTAVKELRLALAALGAN
ncbi:DUF605-domain-containing protein [Periconia macrospinosa]|uniref:DUF605-domain-containing protein n=1 Tax=Periconia macrospinosa TaxID=97972 RepID=A0A2V1E012_9PLEO|nr:DUF605-domain-containing protein [Periconia macrospinosa]